MTNQENFNIKSLDHIKLLEHKSMAYYNLLSSDANLAELKFTAIKVNEIHQELMSYKTLCDNDS